MPEAGLLLSFFYEEAASVAERGPMGGFGATVS
jgi:hypothetical protein